jgi:hypothetical protein
MSERMDGNGRGEKDWNKSWADRQRERPAMRVERQLDFLNTWKTGSSHRFDGLQTLHTAPSHSDQTIIPITMATQCLDDSSDDKDGSKRDLSNGYLATGSRLVSKEPGVASG